MASNGSTDGDVNFSVTATDIVDKTTSLTRTVTVDATSPVISIDGVIAGLNVSSNQVNGIITFRFSADDTGVGLEKTGVNYQAYYTLENDGVVPTQTAAAIAGWTSITSTSSVFSFTYDTSALGTAGVVDKDLYVGIRDNVTGGYNVQAVKTDLAINQNSNRPVITLDNLDKDAVDNFINGFGQNPTLLLTIEDDDKVAVADLQYRIDINNDGDFGDTLDFWNGTPPSISADGDTLDKWENEVNWYAVEEVPVSDRSLAQGKIKLTGFPQGSFRVQIRAKDNTDATLWGTLYGDAGNFTWNESLLVRFSVDYGPPSIAITAPLSGTYKADFALTGTAVDALGVVKVEYVINSVRYPVWTGNQLSYPINTTVDADILPSGAYVLCSYRYGIATRHRGGSQRIFRLCEG